MCTFSESCGTILDTSLLEAYDILPNGTHGSWLGADVGRKHDKTALVTGTERDGVLYVTGAKVLSGMQYRD